MKILHVVDRFCDQSGPLERAMHMTKIAEVCVLAIFESPDCSIISPFKKNRFLSFEQLPENRNVFGILSNIYTFLLEFNPDIVNTHHHRSGLLVRLLKIMNFFRQPLVHSVGNSFSEFSFLARLAHLMTLPFCDSTVFVSQSSFDSISCENKRKFPNPHIIKNGINISHVKPSPMITREQLCQKYGIQLPGLTVCTVSRLAEQKDCKTIISAFAEFSLTDDTARFVLIGDGSLKQNLLDQCCKLGIMDKVFFMGAVQRQEVYDIVSISDIFVLASLWEGLNVSLLQAMALGKPCIVSDISSFNEVIEDGVSGLLFSPSDPHALFSKLSTLRASEYQRNVLGESARVNVLENFDIEKTILNYEKLYLTLLNKNYDAHPRKK